MNYQISQILGNIFSPTRSRSSSSTQSTSPLLHSQSDQYITNNQHSPESKLFSHPPKEKPKSLQRALWNTIRSTAVVLIAVVVTSALIASGVGIVGIGVAIGAGVLAGTAFGATTNALTCAANDDWSDFWSQTFDDFKSSCIGSISTAAGCGVARLVTGSGQAAIQASASRKLWANVASGVTNTTVSTSSNLGLRYATARQDFKEFLKQNNLENCSNEEKNRLYQDFLRQNGLDNISIIKTFGFAVLTSVVSRKISGRFQISRETQAQAALSQGLNISRFQATKSILAENTILTGVGLSSGMLERGNSFTLEQKVGTVFGNYAGGITGHLSSNYVQPKIQAISNRRF